ALAIAPFNPVSPAQPGAPVAVAGVPADKTTAGTGTDGFTVSQYNPANASNGLAYQFGKAISQAAGSYMAFDPSSSHPHPESATKNVSKTPGRDPTKGFGISAFAGWGLDGVAGEASLSWSKVPANAEQNIPEPTTWLAWTLTCAAAGSELRRRRRHQA